MNKNNIPYWALMVYTVTAPTLAAAGVFGDNNRVEIGVLLLTVGVTSTVLTRLKDVIIIKFGMLQTQLQQKIDEASATIEQLRALAKALAKPTFANLAIGGYLNESKRFPARYQVYLEIDRALASIGVPDTEREKISSQWKDEARSQIARYILNDVYNDRHDLREKILILGRENNNKPALPHLYREFLEQNNLLDDEHIKRIENYEDFLNNKTLRHPESTH